MRKLYLFVLFALFATTAGTAHAQQLATAQLKDNSGFNILSPDQKPYHDDQIFVKFRAESTGTAIAFSDKKARGQKLKQDKISKALLKADARAVKQAVGKSMGKSVDRIFQVEIDGSKAAVDQLLQELNAMPEVEYAERVPIYYTHAAPNDPSYASGFQYSLSITKAIQGFSSFNNTGSKPIKLAIVDDAVLISHTDLNANIWQNPGETGLDANGNDKATNGIDDDGNGYIDDVYGWDAADNDNNPNPPLNRATPSVFSHGTHCAGIAGAVTGNGIGVAAVSNNKVQIVPVKCTFDNATNTNAINTSFAGLLYAVRGAKADVVSMSFGGGAYSQAFQDLIHEGADRGMIFVASAGNNANDVEQYPANYQHVISVANSDAADRKSSSSTFGNWVTITAPGTSIYNTVPGTGADVATGAYGYKTGTSMSGPMVAGLVGIMKSQNPALTPEQVKQILISTADNIDLMNPGYEGLLGGGRINAYEALRAAGGTALPASADFILNKAQVIVGEKVSFVNRSIGASSFAWTFENADRASSTEQNPTVTFTKAGTQTVTLTINGSATKSMQVEVTGFAEADILGLPLAGPVGASGINGHSTNNIPGLANFYKYTETHQIAGVNISFRIATAGNANSNIRIKVWDVDRGVPGAVLHTQTVKISDLVANNLVGTLSPNYFYFDKPVTIPAHKSFYIGFEIDYGTGDNISIHHYTSAAAGMDAVLYFNNRWQLNGQIGVPWTFAIFPIVVEKGLFPSGALSVSAKEACLGAEVQFNAADIKPATSYTWNLGNGTTATGTSAATSYTAGGSFQASVMAMRPFSFTEGDITYDVQLRNTIGQTISVSDCGKAPVAAFDATTLTASAGSSIRFVNKTQDATSYEWLIVQGGQRITSTEANPTISFTQKGKYDVTLVAKNPVGQVSEIYKKQYIEIFSEGQGCSTTDLPFGRLTAYGYQGGATSGTNNLRIADYAQRFDLSAGQVLTTAILNVFGVTNTANAFIQVKVWDASGPNGTPGQVISSTPVSFSSLLQARQTNGGDIHVVLAQPVVASTARQVYVGFSLNYGAGEVFYLSTRVAGAGMGERSVAKVGNNWVNMINWVGLYSDLAIAIGTIDNADKLPTADFKLSAATVAVGQPLQLDARQSKKALIYNWDVNGGDLSFAPVSGRNAGYDYTKGTVTFSQPGIYTIKLTVEGDCDAKVSTKSLQVEVTGAGLTAQNQSALTEMAPDDMVYPNPSTGTFNLVLNGQVNEQLHISIWDVKGQLIQQHDITLQNKSDVKQISLEQAPKGLYLIKVSNGSRLQTHKVVKE